MKCDEKLVRLEETYGDWVKKDQENCRLSSGAMTKKLYPYKALFSPNGARYLVQDALKKINTFNRIVFI